ncbi:MULTISPECIES: hypothetical protein [Methylobacterium]|uniref:Uncharacterized protein n=2 Tax=Pseudomonadota TaxID=1224 RepID=A0ABQ4SZL9_9HYPH|nr:MULTISPECIES: hypothetical protein [Methylobacterium]PIU07173.1 MAG: hypothetical protein COT56_05885 [Methylobacterium sp. CG09_land_8_20_14_0_10_71_15]PIU12665.1 MAG: hypothetical protein COT28_14245 [Methylobacterium sp. CG08_land_8_20_14_0_20_71_15]GJE08532.1 hypothetical protein AOPFMNJM_3872 [Methylobacterium jeotgali]
MRLLSRLLLAGLGLLAAIPCGTLALMAGLVLDPAADAWLARAGLAGLDALSDLSAGLPPESLALLAAGLAQALFALLVVPPVAVALIGEVAGLRALAWYGAATGLLTAAIPWLVRGAPRAGGEAARLAAEGRLTALLFVAGAVAGLVYWVVAGRGAGASADRPR